ncbi:MAG: ABC transporter permease [Acidimicrobiia bacterium]|nr:ABC transporter permease [Acidimicrobiia bacterium]MDH5615493.1 ABC transporter permease [Acidimicrobiia bacterium]
MAVNVQAGAYGDSTVVRTGPRRWLRSYVMMMRFDVRGLGQWLTIGIAIQVLMGAGAALMYGFYLGDVPDVAKIFIATGVPALGLIPMGFVMVPQMVGQQRIAQTYDFIWSLPVPRLAAAASTFTVFTLMALPGFATSLGVGVWYYGVDLQVSWLVVPAVLLTSLMCTSVGFGMAHAIKNPMVINFIANMIIFFVLLFSPIIVPIAQFPDLFASVHRVLPFYHMAQVIRDALSNGFVTDVGTSYLVLGVWTLGGWMATAWVVGRRG